MSPLRSLSRALLLAATLVASGAVAAPEPFDEDRAVSSLKDSGCTKCHSLNKRKKGPSYREVARKYSTKNDAMDILRRHLSGGAVVKSEDGDEEHATPKTNDKAEIDNLIRFILYSKYE